MNDKELEGFKKFYSGYYIKRVSRESIYVYTGIEDSQSNQEIVYRNGEWFSLDGRKVLNDGWIRAIEEFLVYERKKKLAKLLEND